MIYPNQCNLSGLNARNHAVILSARLIGVQQTPSLLDFSLRQILAFEQLTYAVADDHAISPSPLELTIFTAHASGHVLLQEEPKTVIFSVMREGVTVCGQAAYRLLVVCRT